MNIDDLSSRISKNFDGVDAPRSNDIADVGDWDFESINNDFRQFLNVSVSRSVLERHPKSLPALTPRAFVFFLKDYMRYALDNIDSELTEHLIYRLAALDPKKKFWAERIVLFTSEQSRVISEFCSFVMELMPEEEKSLKEHLSKAAVTWGKAGGRQF